MHAYPEMLQEHRVIAPAPQRAHPQTVCHLQRVLRRPHRRHLRIHGAKVLACVVGRVPQRAVRVGGVRDSFGGLAHDVCERGRGLGGEVRAGRGAICP